MLRDRTNGTTVYISKAAGTNNAADGGSYVTWMSDDGSSIVVASRAGNLITPNFTSGDYQLFLYDLQTDSFELLTDDNQGGRLGGESYEGSLSADGRYLLFVNLGNANLDPNENNQVILRDRNRGEYRIVSSVSGGDPNPDSNYVYSSGMTPDGRYIVFESDADDLAVQSVVSNFFQVFATLNPFL